MNEILTINYESENPTVSARELHEKLHIGTKFTTWFGILAELFIIMCLLAVIWQQICEKKGGTDEQN